MPSRRTGRRAIARAVAFLLLLLLGGAGAPCLAADTLSVDVGAIYASNQGSSVDPALSHIRGKLQSMFNYSSYKMLNRERRTLAVGETWDCGLPGRRSMRVVPQPPQGNKVRLAIQIQEGGRNLLSTTVGMSRGGMVLVGGPSHEAGVLILIISAE
ncbi:MAG: hypothetical protein H6Q84_2323 [Deltaproteobacteria bacterium]|nr:hypothetical protein [Deltaproteobacteria bacterium]